MKQALIFFAVFFFAWGPLSARTLIPDRDVKLAQKHFGQKLFSTILERKAGDTENVFISPPSAFFALSMLMEGSDTTTRRALLEGLQMDAEGYDHTLGVNLIHSMNRAYYKDLNGLSDVTLRLANAVWINETFPVKNAFVDALKHYYDAEAANVDFRNNTAKVVEDINSWAAKATNDRIRSVITEDKARRLVMLLANAIYFKGSWQTEFDRKKTTTESHYFTLSDGSQMDAQVMHSGEKMDYYESADGTQVGRLPFKGESMGFYIVLPPAGINAKKAIAERMNDTFWDGVFQEIRPWDVDLELPKFKFKTKETLNRDLKALGMSEIFFTPDFSRLSEAPTAVSFVNQDAFIQVDETGAEAAAVTTIGMIRTSVPVRKMFQLNRPFAIAIMDEVNKNFLFLGLIENPAWEN